MVDAGDVLLYGKDCLYAMHFVSHFAAVVAALCAVSLSL